MVFYILCKLTLFVIYQLTSSSSFLFKGILLVYDITNEKSFDSIRNWIRNIEENAPTDVERMLIGNKCDMNDDRKVSKEIGEKVEKRLLLYL